MKYWRTKEEKFIPINELSDEHLVNIWNMIKGKIYKQSTASLRGQAESMLQGEMALDSVEEYFDENGETLDNDYFYYKHSSYDDIFKEITSRKLFNATDSKIIERVDEALREFNEPWKNH